MSGELKSEYDDFVDPLFFDQREDHQATHSAFDRMRDFVLSSNEASRLKDTVLCGICLQNVDAALCSRFSQEPLSVNERYYF